MTRDKEGFGLKDSLYVAFFVVVFPPLIYGVIFYQALRFAAWVERVSK